MILTKEDNEQGSSMVPTKEVLWLQPRKFYGFYGRNQGSSMVANYQGSSILATYQGSSIVAIK